LRRGDTTRGGSHYTERSERRTRYPLPRTESLIRFIITASFIPAIFFSSVSSAVPSFSATYAQHWRDNPSNAVVVRLTFGRFVGRFAASRPRDSPNYLIRFAPSVRTFRRARLLPTFLLMVGNFRNENFRRADVGTFSIYTFPTYWRTPVVRARFPCHDDDVFFGQ